jgi:hypothetical protein
VQFADREIGQAKRTINLRTSSKTTQCWLFSFGVVFIFHAMSLPFFFSGVAFFVVSLLGF